MSRKKITFAMVSIALLVLLVLVLMLSPWFTIETIEINGLKNLEKPEIIKELNLNEKTNIFAFNKSKSIKILKENGYIESIKINRKLPNKLVINIVERDVAFYIAFFNEYLYMDKTGFIIDIKPSYVKNLPLIYGLKFEKFLVGQHLKISNPETLEVVKEFSDILSEKNMLENIYKIDVSNLDDLQIHINNIIVVLGNRENLQQKIDILSEILKNFSSEEKGFLYIDDINKAPFFKYMT